MMDEDANNDSDSDSLEDVLDQPPAKPITNLLKTSGKWRRNGQKMLQPKIKIRMREVKKKQ